MINIRQSTTICKNYNEISELCQHAGGPVYLMKNGTGDLVVKDVEAFARRASILGPREALLCSEEDRVAGKPGHTIGKMAQMLRRAIQEATDAKPG